MQTILAILKQAGGWNHGLYLKIKNPPHITLVIDAMDEFGPCGLPALSVAQYGDALCKPEMCFELGLADGSHLNPFYYRNDSAGIEQWSRYIYDGDYIHLSDVHMQHERLARQWHNDLRFQGFLEAFERRHPPHP
jgi:hypothetical protein